MINGPYDEERWGTVGFLTADEKTVPECRTAARWLMSRFRLDWVPDLADDVETMVSELVTNVQRYGGDIFPAGSFTLWHPNKWLVLTVHDKNPYQPYKELNHASASWDAEGGRGLGIVKSLAARHLGEVDFARDHDTEMPGKVTRVRMLLPDVMWPNTFRDPHKGRTIIGHGCPGYDPLSRTG
jgi:hypothetical protein